MSVSTNTMIYSPKRAIPAPENESLLPLITECFAYQPSSIQAVHGKMRPRVNVNAIVVTIP